MWQYGKTLVEALLAHDSSIGAAEAYLIQIAAAAGRDDHTAYLCLKDMCGDICSSLIGACLGYIPQATDAGYTQHFSAHPGEVYH
jgi:hypothetical protein